MTLLSDLSQTGQVLKAEKAFGDNDTKNKIKLKVNKVVQCTNYK